MSKQPSSFAIRTILCSNGERLPVLIDRATGIPVFEAVIYAVSELRGKNLASNTILQALRSVMILYIVLERLGIDMNRRLAQGALLDAGEIEEIVQASKTTLSALLDSPVQASVQTPKKMLSIEKARMAQTRQKIDTEVEPSTIAIRLNYIRDYLRWHTTNWMLRTSSIDARAAMGSLVELVDNALKNKTPQVTGRNQLYQRMGLSKEAQNYLLKAIGLASLDNPWVGKHARARNVLIVRILIELGVRRGELLGVRVEDVNTQRNELFIYRRPDDLTDPRLVEPNTKTRDRLLAISDDLAHQIRQYVAIRRNIPGARKHGFLLVANGSGKPMSFSAFNRIFKVLQQLSPLLKYIYPHILRHTFNDNLSDLFDRAKTPPDQEIQIRNRLNGWAEKSQMAIVYTKRHTQQKANEAIISMQEHLTVGNSNE